MGVQRHDECAAVDEICPQPKIDRGVAAHHPSEEQADTFAGGLGVLGDDCTHAMIVKVSADGCDSSVSVCGMKPDIIAQRTVCQQQLPISLEETMHSVVFI